MRDADLKVLWGRASGRCSYPECRTELMDEPALTMTNQVAHIVSKEAGGPRSDAMFPRAELDLYENLILLCSSHHLAVDNENGRHFTAGDLQRMKRAHEDWVRQRTSAHPPWNAPVSQLHYVNVPRLAIVAALHGVEIPLDFAVTPLNELGLGLVRVLMSLESAVNELCGSIRAVPLTPQWVGRPGEFVSFSESFRTKGMPPPHLASSYKMRPGYASNPHVYRALAGARLLLPLDPRWVTTNTAFVDFTSGSTFLSGLAQVKSSDGSTLVASPLFLGLPRDAFGS